VGIIGDVKSLLNPIKMGLDGKLAVLKRRLHRRA